MMQYLEQNNAAFTKKNEAFTEIMHALQRFIAAPELTGYAWSAAKDYADTAHVPLLRGFIRANEAMIEDNQIFATRIADRIENEEIDEEVLMQIIERLERQKQAIFYRNHLLAGSPSFGVRNATVLQDASSEEAMIAMLKKEIHALRELDAVCQDLYVTAESLLADVERGLAAINSGDCWNATTGIYSTATLKLDWAKRLNKDWQIVKEKTAIQKLVDEFNMDPKQAEQIVVFERKFKAYAKKMNWSTEQANLEFVKIMASMRYGRSSTGIINTTIWGISADVLNEEALRHQLKAMGYAYPQIDILMSEMNELYEKKDLKNDYIHVMGSLAAMMNDSKLSTVYHIGTTGFDFKSYFREAATWSADIASNGLSVEDVRADLDAIALAYRLAQNPSDRVSQVISNYYEEIATGRLNRAEEFLKYYGNGEVEKGYEMFMKDLPKMLVNPANVLFIFKNDFKKFLQGDFSDTQEAIKQFIKLFNDELEKGRTNQ